MYVIVVMLHSVDPNSFGDYPIESSSLDDVIGPFSERSAAQKYGEEQKAASYSSTWSWFTYEVEEVTAP